MVSLTWNVRPHCDDGYEMYPPRWHVALYMNGRCWWVKGYDFYPLPRALKHLCLPSYETPFYHMSDAVLEEYESRGVTKENMVIPKDYRDANPCVFGSGSGNDEIVHVAN